MNRKVIVESSKIVFDDFYKLEEATFQYELPDGKMTEPQTRLCFHRGDSVACAVWNTDTKQAIMVRQFRYPGYVHGDGWITEVVAGMLKQGHDPVDEMKREVMEEIGYEVAAIEHITTCYASPGGSSERVFLYYVEVNDTGHKTDGGGLEEESENIEILHYSLDELKAALKHNDIKDAKSIIACNYLLAKQA